jgi:hypothetical protein
MVSAMLGNPVRAGQPWTALAPSALATLVSFS